MSVPSKPPLSPAAIVSLTIQAVQEQRATAATEGVTYFRIPSGHLVCAKCGGELVRHTTVWTPRASYWVLDHAMHCFPTGT